MLHSRFIRRQLTRSGKQAWIFVVCVALALVDLLVLNGFSNTVDRSLRSDARALLAADVVVSSRFEFSRPLEEALTRMAEAGRLQKARLHEFYSMVRTATGKDSLLANIKVVAAGYPFYGTLKLESGKNFERVLTPGKVVVAQALLDRLKLEVGQQLHVGQALLTIADVVTSEPDRPMDLFSMGPRILVAGEDLQRLDLVRKGSHIRHRYLLKVAGSRSLSHVVAELKTVALKDQERVDTYRTARSRVKKFFDNFFFFLNLISMFTLLLAGIGIQSTLAALLKDKQETIAIMKAVGATNRTIVSQYLVVCGLLGVAGILAGLVAGTGLLHWVPVLVQDLLPSGASVGFTAGILMESIGVCLLVVLLFAYLPLAHLRGIKPQIIFRQERIRFERRPATVGSVAAIGCFFILMIFMKFEDHRFSLYFTGEALGLVLVTSLWTGLIVWGLKKLPVTHLTVRQALKGLFRPRNATRAAVITLSSALTVIFSIHLIEKNLDAAFVKSYPGEAPNVFFVDIQPDQLAAFERALAQSSQYHALIRAKIIGINGQPVDPAKERRRRGDNLSRPFNLTHRHVLLEDEKIIAGNSLFPPATDPIPVSILDTVADMAAIGLGDRIAFRIQGVPLTAVVSSIRTQTGDAFRPFFYFVFPPEVLQAAPQTLFTALRVPPERISSLQNRMVAAFPNVSVIDLSAAVVKIAGVVKKLSNMIRFFTFFSIAAGLLIIVSSVMATRMARTREAVYFKILGATRGFVVRVFSLENGFIGLISGIIALFQAQLVAWWVVNTVLDIRYQAFIGTSLTWVAATVLLVAVVGLLPSLSVLRQKPFGFLKQQSQ